jgi:choline dehydrogenase
MGNPRTDWMMRTGAEPGLNGRALAYPRGKLLGGCSSINGMIYMRGQSADYDHWRQLGNVGWSWDDVLPYFLRSEDHHGGKTDLHGVGGAWKVAPQRLKWPILRELQEAAREAGIEPRADFNDGNNEGSGFFEVNQKNGQRWSTARGFLRPALKRGNLRLLTGAETETLILEDRRVAGVRFRHGGRTRSSKAMRGVILAAGAIHSPKLLELSGIGDVERLAEIGIEPRHALAQVGENLQDHLQIRTVYKVKNARTLNTMANSLFGKARIGFEYALTRGGPLSMAPSQFGMFTRSDPSLATPDLEYHVQPLSTDKLGDPLHPFPAITVSVCNLRPESRGATHATTADIGDHPRIQPNYLSDERDRQVALKSVRQARNIMSARALARFEPTEMLPGPGIEDDGDMLGAIGDIATTIFHPVGTCRMGTDSDAVVDPRLRVNGMSGLRIVDASIMPRIVSGNTASPVVMIAEKAADMIIEDDRASRRAAP